MSTKSYKSTSDASVRSPYQIFDDAVKTVRSEADDLIRTSKHMNLDPEPLERLDNDQWVLHFSSVDAKDLNPTLNLNVVQAPHTCNGDKWRQDARLVSTRFVQSATVDRRCRMSPSGAADATQAMRRPARLSPPVRRTLWFTTNVGLILIPFIAYESAVFQYLATGKYSLVNAVTAMEAKGIHSTQAVFTQLRSINLAVLDFLSFSSSQPQRRPVGFTANLTTGELLASAQQTASSPKLDSFTSLTNPAAINTPLPEQNTLSFTTQLPLGSPDSPELKTGDGKPYPGNRLGADEKIGSLLPAHSPELTPLAFQRAELPTGHRLEKHAVHHDEVPPDIISLEAPEVSKSSQPATLTAVEEAPSEILSTAAQVDPVLQPTSPESHLAENSISARSKEIDGVVRQAMTLILEGDVTTARPLLERSLRLRLRTYQPANK